MLTVGLYCQSRWGEMDDQWITVDRQSGEAGTVGKTGVRMSTRTWPDFNLPFSARCTRNLP